MGRGGSTPAATAGGGGGSSSRRLILWVLFAMGFILTYTQLTFVFRPSWLHLNSNPGSGATPTHSSSSVAPISSRSSDPDVNSATARRLEPNAAAAGPIEGDREEGGGGGGVVDGVVKPANIPRQQLVEVEATTAVPVKSGSGGEDISGGSEFSHLEPKAEGDVITATGGGSNVLWLSQRAARIEHWRHSSYTAAAAAGGGGGAALPSVLEKNGLIEKAKAESKKGPVSFRHDCSSVVSTVVVDADNGLLFPTYRGKPSVSLPTCSIAAVKPHSYDYPTNHIGAGRDVNSLCGGGAGGKESSGNNSFEPFAVISQIERPQHAAHCLWSIMGVVAAQMEAGVDIATTPAHVTIMSYGVFGNWTHFKNLRRFPHIELLEVLSKTRVSLYRDQNVRRVMVAPALESSADTADRQLLDQMYGGDLTSRKPPGGGGATAEGETSPQHPRRVSCYRAALVGSIPMRIPRVSVPTQLRPNHFQEMRRRLIDYFQLRELTKEERQSKKPYMLLVSRLKQKRRLILNKAKLAEVVRQKIGVEVREVDWEGMSLRDQLQLAINAVGMLGTHGNGMAWAPFMPLGSAMLELGSKWSKRNEVKVGKNIANSANIAEWCGMKSLSIRCDFVENEFSRKTSPTRVWKEVDIRISLEQLADIVTFLQPWKQ